MDKAVHRMILEMRTVDEIVDKVFYIVCFNVLCCTDNDEHIPNEIGIVKYSIRRGIEDYYHCFIDPGAVPFGYTRISKEHSENTHSIPISGFEKADNNYDKICKMILDNVNPMQIHEVPVFCAEDMLQQNRGCLRWLSSKANHLEVEMECIRFYDVTCLLIELRAKMNKAFPSRAIAVDFLSNHSFDYIPNTRCDYHEDLDNAYCALGSAKRICFILSDALCTLYDVDCTPNHLPSRVGDVQMEILQPMFPPSRSVVYPKLSEQYAGGHGNVPKTYGNIAGKHSEKAVKNSDKDYSGPWMKKFHQPKPAQADVLFSNDDFPPLNSKNPSKLGEI